MTEAEYKTLPGANLLPLYDEDDERCTHIEQPNSSRYDTVREATDLDDALACIRDPELEFRGGIRYTSEDGSRFVYAYFWKRR